MDSVKLCAVCSCPPLKGRITHYTFYGAIVCFSCKAFFKRCHDDAIVGDKLKLVCKKNSPGNCAVHFKSNVKMRCRHCRYLKCLSVGMDPEKIKSGEERKKYTRINLYCFKKTTKGIINVDLNERMNLIILAYQRTMADKVLEKGLIDYLVIGHCHQTEWTYDHTSAFLHAMKEHASSIINMTSRLDYFQVICKEDRNLLFQLNQYLFYQYIMSRYFKSGSTQICWLLEKDPAEVFGKLDL